MASVSGNVLLAQALRDEGAEAIFYLAGGPMFDVMWEAMRLGIRAIHTRHEQGAAMMAHGYARLCGRPGLVNTSSGPGTINAATAMSNALSDACPLILLAGASPLRTRNLEDFQEVDQVGAMRPLAKWAAEVHEARRIPEYVNRAFRHALSHRPGPVHLDFPGDVLYSEVEAGDVVRPLRSFPAQPMGDPEAVREAVRLLKAAARPLIISGSGILWSGASQALRAFVDHTGVPFFTTPQGRGAIPDDHPLAFLNARSVAFREADLLLVIGTRLNVILGFGRPPRFAPDAKVIMVNTDAAEMGKGRTVQLGIIGDARTVLMQLLAEAERLGNWPRETMWVRHLRNVHERKLAEREALLNSERVPIHPLRLCNEISKFMERDAVLCVDGHDTLNFARQSIPTFFPGHRLNAGPNGCMGVAIPYAIGAKVAKPDKQVIALTGDGSFGMNGFEMDTAVRERLPILCVICNNGGWTANRPPKPGRDLPFSSYEKFVELFGGFGERVERPEGIRPALERAARSGVPACINVICDPSANSETARFSSYFQESDHRRSDASTAFIKA